MGQDHSQPIQQQIPSLKGSRHLKNYPQKPNYSQIQGLLKYSRTPFSESKKIQLQQFTIFVQKYRMSLRDLLNNKIKLGKKFEKCEIQTLIKNISYVLAQLEDYETPYSILDLNKVYFCNGRFKLIPPELVSVNIVSYFREIIKQKNLQSPISPQIILAIRCKQNIIQQKQILYKTSIFSLGMILLEICTFKSFKQCYDLQTLDIINSIVNQRIQLVQANYSQKEAMLIANMLDYDYIERISPKQLSFLISRIYHQQQQQPLKQIKQLTKKASSRVIKTNKQNRNLALKTKTNIAQKNKTERTYLSQLKIQKQRQKNIIKAHQNTQIKSISKSKSKSKLRIPKKQHLPNPYFDKNIKVQQKTNNLNHQYSIDQHKFAMRPPKYQYDHIQENNINQQHTLNQQLLKQRQINIKYKYNIHENGQIYSGRNRSISRQNNQYNQKQNITHPLVPKQQINQFKLIVQDSDYESYIYKMQAKNKLSNRHTVDQQNLNNKNTDKEKDKRKENDSLLAIHKEIERSRQILQEARKLQQVDFCF